MNINTTRILVIFFYPLLIMSSLFAQSDPVTGYTPRFSTRAKLWEMFRNNGLQGGGNEPRYQSDDQTAFQYPGNAGRGQDFMEYWLDVEAYINGDPNLIDVSRACIPQNARGTGLWICDGFAMDLRDRKSVV